MVGDLQDIVYRLRSVLPKRWFADNSPILAALLQGIATPWVWFYSVISYAIEQTRVLTATDSWLDLIAWDYFGRSLSRKPSELDFSFRGRIQAALQREAATRSAIAEALEQVVGSEPLIFEPARCSDTGCYGTMGPEMNLNTGLAYAAAGGWGSLALPMQFFITTHRPPTPGISMLAGYGTSNGGYGLGFISYIDLSVVPGYVTDQEIQDTLTQLLPVNSIAWLRIS